MKIHQSIKQGSQEWLDLRAENFTASELGPFALEPVKNTMTVDEIKTTLDALNVPRKGLTKRDDLLAKLPNPEHYVQLCQGAQTAIIGKIREGRKLMLKARDRETLTLEEEIWLARDLELDAKEERNFQYNIPVKYGKMLEPFAREFYEQKTGDHVTEVGFIESSHGGFGCSPDGLIGSKDLLIDLNPDGSWKLANIFRGVEIKCPEPHTHLAWLLTGGLPDEHKFQVHSCMAVTSLDQWDFLSYCPGDAPLLVTVHRDEFTEKLASGLKTLVAEKAKMKRRLADLWNSANLKTLNGNIS